MYGALKKIHVNEYEERTAELLTKQVQEDNARVFSKVALKDVLPFETMDVSAELRRFCWVSHFDFVVTNAKTSPLFVVEFDGPSHRGEVQMARDRKKDELCRLFNLPILRINSRYLAPSYRGRDLLSWFAECFFIQRDFVEAENNGWILPEDGFDPMSVASIGERTNWPLDLAHEVRETFRELESNGKIIDAQPSYTIGREGSGAFRAFGFVAVTKNAGVFAKTGMRAQQFEISESEALEILINFEIYGALRKVLDGISNPDQLPAIMDRMERMSKDLHLCRVATMNSEWTTRCMRGRGSALGF